MENMQDEHKDILLKVNKIMASLKLLRLKQISSDGQIDCSGLEGSLTETVEHCASMISRTKRVKVIN